eukprot:TRINITY_DN2326_c0_g1_i1.p1 TRINITY_DN2326_c0_g1~~TRINITY_DN2326_c0_g1_i1.p1  ORF type:complete len:328 (+),score=99.06 TRINITY_DN2326_c0_g1_i1:449-1432(+)
MVAFATPAGALNTPTRAALPARAATTRRPGMTMAARPPPRRPRAPRRRGGRLCGRSPAPSPPRRQRRRLRSRPPKRKGVAKAGIVTTTSAPGLTEVHHHMGALGRDDGRFGAAVAHHADTLAGLEARAGAAAADAPRRRWLLRRRPDGLDDLPGALPEGPTAQALVVMESWAADPATGGRSAASSAAAGRWSSAVLGCRQSLATTPVVSLSYDTVLSVARGGGVGDTPPPGAVVVCEVVNAAAGGEEVASALAAVLTSTAQAVVQNDQALQVTVLRADDGAGHAFFKTVEVYRSVAHWRDHCDGLDAAFFDARAGAAGGGGAQAGRL